MRVLYVCNDRAYFAAHRLWLAEEARRRGATVAVATGGDGAPLPIEEIARLDVVRHGLSPASDALLMRDIHLLAGRFAADVVHFITLKPILFGTLALRASRRPRRIVATFPGLGRVFDETDASPRARLVRRLVTAGLKVGLADERVRAVFETESDRARLLGLGALSPAKAIHIPGAGVDPSVYVRRPLPGGPLKVLFAGRLLRSKGVTILAEAAAIARARGVEVEVEIAGAAQGGDPDGLSTDEVTALAGNPAVRFLGAAPPGEVPALLAGAHAVVLPTSYQEGVPRILIEAASVGRLAIVSDNPGCRALVADGESGVVLGRNTPEDLADALARLAADRALVERLAEGAHARFVEGGFSQAAVGEATLALYEA